MNTGRPTGFHSPSNLPVGSSGIPEPSSSATNQNQQPGQQPGVIASTAHPYHSLGRGRQQGLLNQYNMQPAPTNLGGGMSTTNSAAITNPYESIYERRQRGECSNYLRAEVSFHDDVPDVVKEASRLVTRGLDKIFPPGANTIFLEAFIAGDGLKGLTRILPTQDGAYVKVNTDPTLNFDTQLGLYTHTIAHEFFLHAQSQLEAIHYGVNALQEIDDHRHVYSPGPDNRYLIALCRVFDRLPSPAAQKAFAFGVQEDIRKNADKDEDLDQIQFENIDQWSTLIHDQLIARIPRR